MIAEFKIGSDRLLLQLTARGERMGPIEKAKCAYLLWRVRGVLQAIGSITEDEFRASLAKQPGGEAFLAAIAAGQVKPGDDRLSIDPLNAAEELKIVRQLASERAQGTPARPMPFKAKSIKEKALTFLKAVTGPEASTEMAAARLQICSANTCGHLREEPGERFCGACGCGKWRLARLSRKVRYANLECPCGLWPAVQG